MQLHLGKGRMDSRSTAFTEPAADRSHSCTEPFLLRQLQAGNSDKLGHRVEDILWVGRNYVVYRSEKGVYVQFSDDPQEEATQRASFTKICPELCELRYFTAQIRPSWRSFAGHRDRSSLYDHNIAQAIMLVMERRVDEGKEIAKQALNMVTSRATNDNTIRYVRVCVVSWIICIALGFLLLGSSRIRVGDPGAS